MTSKNPKSKKSRSLKKNKSLKTLRNDADDRIGPQSVQYGTGKKMGYMTWRAKRANRQPEITWDPFTVAEVFASSHPSLSRLYKKKRK